MQTGLILDNAPIGQSVPQSSIDKLVAMGASCVGSLWTAGTHHEREVYERCEAVLDKPLYIVRVGGHRQTAEEWQDWAREALWETPDATLNEGRIVLVMGNEPNLEGWVSDPAGYGKLYSAFSFDKWVCPVLFACPSLGLPDWREYLAAAVKAAGGPPIKNIIINAYEHLVYEVGWIAGFCGAEHVYIGEVNTLKRGAERAEYFQSVAWPYLWACGVEAGLVFIAGGQSGGAWDEGYIVAPEEAAGLKWTPQEVVAMEWTLGFKDYVAKHPEVGTPVENLQYDDHGNGWQHSDTGLLFWHKADNQVHWFARPKA